MDSQGKELPKDEQGKYIGTGTQRIDKTETTSIDDPLTDEQGNAVEAGNVEALLRRVKEHFGREEHENVEVQKVVVQELLTVRVVSGEELARL